MTDLITIDGIAFDPTNRAVWSAVNLRGWKSSPPMRAEIDDRPNADGADDVDRNYRSARTLVFEAVLEGGDSQLALEDAWAGIQADGTPIPISVENAEGVRSVEATLQGVAEVIPDPDHLGATLTGTFICYDPVKYGPAVVQSTGLPSAGGGLEYPLGDPDGALYYGAVGASGRVTVVNTGRAATWPFFRVSGELDGGFEIRCVDTGATLRYERVVPAGTTVTIDSRTGAVLIDDVSDASTYLTRDGFFAVPPMGSCEVQFSAVSTSSGTPILEVTSWSGWW